MTTCTTSGLATITMWTIFDLPKTAKSGFIAREFEILPSGARPTSKSISSPRLATVRKRLAALNLERIERDRNDHPHVVETWL